MKNIKKIELFVGNIDGIGLGLMFHSLDDIDDKKLVQLIKMVDKKSIYAE